MEILIGVFILIAIIFIVLIIVSNNKFQLSIIKIEEAENNVDIFLQTKKDLLERTSPIIIKSLKVEDFLPELSTISNDFNNFELFDLLKKSYNKLFETLDENDKLSKNKKLIELIDKINNNEINLMAAIKFYNDSVVSFNSLVVTFPGSIVAFFKKYQKKDFYNNEKREIYEILNEK